MRLVTGLFVLLTLMASTVLAQETGKVYVKTGWWGVAVSGYNSVAYFTERKPVVGKKEFATKYQGVAYRFASAEHRDMFNKEPQKYAPQYGGFCGWAVAQEYTAGIDPNAWDIVEARLILNYSLDIREKFRAGRKGFIEKADKNWPKIRDDNGKKSAK